MPPVALDPRDLNFAGVIATVKEWAAEHDVSPTAHLLRTVFAVFTETGGYIYANRGEAFTTDTQWSREMPPEQRARVVAILKGSLAFDHDKVGRNGGSTGILQQLSRQYVQAALGGGWGWGTIADTMHVRTAARMFVNAVRVTGDTVYVAADGARITLSHSIAADVLRVQRPLASEAKSSNYDAAQVARARHLVEHWRSDYFTNPGA